MAAWIAVLGVIYALIVVSVWTWRRDQAWRERDAEQTAAIAALQERVRALRILGEWRDEDNGDDPPSSHLRRVKGVVLILLAPVALLAATSRAHPVVASLGAVAVAATVALVAQDPGDRTTPSAGVEIPSEAPLAPSPGSSATTSTTTSATTSTAVPLDGERPAGPTSPTTTAGSSPEADREAGGATTPDPEVDTTGGEGAETPDFSTTTTTVPPDPGLRGPDDPSCLIEIDLLDGVVTLCAL